MIYHNDENFALQVAVAREVLNTAKDCDKQCWKCWVSWNPRECREEVRYSREVLDELPWIED